jgi:hypothetical protein
VAIELSSQWGEGLDPSDQRREDSALKGLASFPYGDTWGGELSEDIFPELKTKSNIPQQNEIIKSC